MRGYSRGVRVQVYFGETEQVGHVPRYQALLAYLRKEGAAGATVTRGVAGFGANSTIHTAAILRLSLDLPMVVTWIDAPGRVERLLPGLCALAGSGIVTVEELRIAAYGGRRLEQLRFDLPIEDVMTRPVVAVEETSSVREAVERLIGREFRALPVVDADGVLVGVLSGGDLVTRAGLGARVELLAAMSDEARTAFLDGLPDRRAGDVMTRDPVVLRQSDTLAKATHLMAERKLKRLPIVADDGRLVGIVARADVLRAVGETFPQDVAASADLPGALTVGEIMRTDCPTVLGDADLSTLLDVVVSTRLNRAVIVDRSNVVLGVVSDADVLRSVDPSADAGVIGALMRSAGRPSGAKVQARALITRPPVTVPPETPIAEAASQMVEARVKVVCVVDAERRLLGIVDRADILRAAGDALREKFVVDSAGEDDAD